MKYLILLFSFSALADTPPTKLNPKFIDKTAICAQPTTDANIKMKLFLNCPGVN